MTDISREKIENWFDEDLVEDYHDVTESEEGVEFHFAVKLSNLGIDVVRKSNDGPVLIVSTMVLADEHLSVFESLSSTQKNDILSQIGAVLTNSPGIYRFTDGMGNDVGFEEMSAIRVEHRVYPDGASQHTFMNGIVGVANALVYIRMVFNTFLSNIESHL